MAMLAVAAYAQNLGTLLLELAVGQSERGDLVRSTACEIKYVKGKDYIFLAFELTQADLLPRL